MKKITYFLQTCKYIYFFRKKYEKDWPYLFDRILSQCLENYLILFEMFTERERNFKLNRVKSKIRRNNNETKQLFYNIIRF